MDGPLIWKWKRLQAGWERQTAREVNKIYVHVSVVTWESNLEEGEEEEEEGEAEGEGKGGEGEMKSEGEMKASWRANEESKWRKQMKKAKEERRKECMYDQWDGQ